jgi:hypothetical protein
MSPVQIDTTKAATSTPWSPQSSQNDLNRSGDSSV